VASYVQILCPGCLQRLSLSIAQRLQLAGGASAYGFVMAAPFSPGPLRRGQLVGVAPWDTVLLDRLKAVAAVVQLGCNGLLAEAAPQHVLMTRLAVVASVTMFVNYVELSLGVGALGHMVPLPQPPIRARVINPFISQSLLN